MYQKQHRAATNCCQTSGWHENKLQLYKQRRKKKKEKFIDISNYSVNYNINQLISMPRMLNNAIIFTYLPTILSFLWFTINFSNCQLVVDHPKYRYNNNNNNNYHHHHYNEKNNFSNQDTQLQANHQIPISPPYTLSNTNDFLRNYRINPRKSIDLNETTMPTTKEKQNELLRKLSSTMLLETLLRHPFPINKSPFPPLTLPSILPNNQILRNSNNSTKNSFHNDSNDENWPNKNKINNNINHTVESISEPKKISKINKGQETNSTRQFASKIAESSMDVSATSNITLFNESDKTLLPYNNLTNTTTNKSPEIFNASALNYLVDRLLSVKTSDYGIKAKRKRPVRQKIESSPPDTDSLTLLLKANKPIVTLDMLIKDEYDLRVKPMIKSLSEQQRLSHLRNQYKDTTTSVGPTNHKFEESASMFGATTVTPPANNFTEQTTTNILTTTTTPPSPLIKSTNNSNTLVSFEDLEDLEESEEEDYADNNNSGKEDDPSLSSLPSIDDNSLKNHKIKANLSTSDVKKILQNVPPYQLNNDFDKIRTTNFSKPLKSLLEIQTTTNDPVTLEANNSIGKYLGEKSADASTRGTLVFSDGGYEAERAKLDKKRQENRLNSSNTYGIRNSIINRIDNKTTNHNTTLDQFPPAPMSTTETNFNIDRTDSFLLEQLLSTVNPLSELDSKLKERYNQKELSMNNPLIYKGYVGKDDYLFSSTARDWSKPIITRDITTTDGNYKYLFPSTTPAPPTEPPSVPYNYYLHQPVTNAQSVPSMVIPNSNTFLETTTQSPITINSVDAIRGKNVLQPPQLRTVQQQSNNYHRLNNNNRKYSYQLPDKNNKNISMSNKNNNLSSISISSLKPINLNDSLSYEQSRMKDNNAMQQFKTNWTPTKAHEDYENFQLFNKTSTKRRQQQQNYPLNSTSPLLVPVIKVNTIPQSSNVIAGSGGLTKISNQLQKGKVAITDGNNIETSNENSFTNDTTQASTSDIDRLNKNIFQKNILHTNNNNSKIRFTSQRNKSKIPNSFITELSNSPGTDGSISDTEDGEQDNNQNNFSENKNIKIPLTNDTQQNFTDSNLENGGEGNGLNHQIGIDEESYEEDYSSDNSSINNNSKKHNNQNVVPKNGQSSINKFYSENIPQLYNGVKNNKNHMKKTQLISHEPAGSEISLSGLDKSLDFVGGRKRITNNNSTQKISKKHQILPIEKVFTDSGDGSSTITTTTTSTTASLNPTPNLSYSSTIIPNTNFFGEASSESPTLYNTISNIELNNLNNKQLSTTSQPSLEDPYQRIVPSTNNILSVTQQPSLSSTTSTPKLLITTPNLKQEEFSTNSISASGPSPVKPNSSKSNDRFYLFLLGGSFAISIVCLVFAVMSMKCGDMCDDYHSLRNAERAALKLQKHRLKYTKNHQINRFNQQSSSDIGQSLIEEVNNNNNNNSSSIESDLNNMRNFKGVGSDNNNNNNSNNKNNNSQENGFWNSSTNNYQTSFPAFINKDLQVCRCGNCLNHRWLNHHEDIIGSSNKHMSSWMNPHYYMQNNSRLRPLFGAGSSVGTFFPRRLDEQTGYHGSGGGGGSTDAQILIDNQPPHSCVLIEPQRNAITRTKSILHKDNRKTTHRFNDIIPTTTTTNYGCNNPEHNHNHVCHHHHHHHMDPSTSEESEEIFDESIKCDNHRCLNHQNNRNRTNGNRSNGHNHQTNVWKLASVRKNSQGNNHNQVHNHHSHNHHHHNHHQQVSSSDSSSIAQCTCSRDQQPLISAGRHQNLHKNGHNKHALKLDSRASIKHQARRDKSMLVWSTNRDRLI